ncbi:aryl sulfotransferase, partial [Salmonella enterica]|nr:aryl sulfotransferase [Salmonella enterica]
WEYIIPFFNEYPEHLSKGIIPGKQNSAFRAHRYAADAISWLK